MARHVAVSKLVQYLRIKTVHPEPDYASAIAFLKDYAKEIGVDDCREVQVAPNRSILIMSYFGKSLNEKSVLLNSHMDVVPVNTEFWKCDPFEGKRYENGDIYGRGVQDMKSVGIQHLELIRKMKENNVKPNRTIHLTFAPDEEIGGVNGVGAFIKTKEFQDLNVGVCLDEGLANPTEEFSVFYGERVQMWITVKFTGNTGHGSRFIENTAAEKLRKVLNKMLAYRQEQKHILETNCSCMKLGEVTTVNLTGLKGGLAHNIVPAVFEANFDIRITPATDLNTFRAQLQDWITEAEDGDTGSITYDFVHGKDAKPAMSSTDEDQNLWWKSFIKSCSDLNVKLSKEIFPAGTDARYLREIGITAFGFTPLNNTPILLHDHNEYINEDVFIRGIDILYKIVHDLANVE